MSVPPNYPVVDTHFHLWDLDKFTTVWPHSGEELKKIYRNFLPQDYDKERKTTPIQYSVFVEVVESLEEIKWLLQLADENPFIKGVVGYMDLTSKSLENDVIELKKNPKFVGVRKITDLCEDVNWLERDDGMKILERHNLTYDLLIKTRPEHETAKRLLKQAPPNLKIVINHLGKPNAKTGAEKAWFDDIAEMATYNNVHCKLSGMVTEADLCHWKPSDFKPHVDHVIKHFGIDRVMFGSDWPVCKLANADLKDVYALLHGLLEDLSEEDKAKVFGKNAIKFYNLKLD